MSGKPGRSGTNKGKDKPWADALRLEINECAGDTKKIRLVARAVIDAAIGGDVQAAKEIGDRLDGKATQQIEHTGAEGGPIKTQAVKDEQSALEKLLTESRPSDQPGSGNPVVH